MNWQVKGRYLVPNTHTSFTVVLWICSLEVYTSEQRKFQFLLIRFSLAGPCTDRTSGSLYKCSVNWLQWCERKVANNTPTLFSSCCFQGSQFVWLGSVTNTATYRSASVTRHQWEVSWRHASLSPRSTGALTGSQLALWHLHVHVHVYVHETWMWNFCIIRGNINLRYIIKWQLVKNLQVYLSPITLARAHVHSFESFDPFVPRPFSTL